MASRHNKRVSKAFEKTKALSDEIHTLVERGGYVSAFVLKFLFLEQFLEVLISIVFLQLNGERNSQLVELTHSNMSDATFGHKVMYLQKLNKQYSLGIQEGLFRNFQKISSFRNKTVHRLLHPDTDMKLLNDVAKKWLGSIDSLQEQLFSDFLKRTSK